MQPTQRFVKARELKLSDVFYFPQTNQFDQRPPPPSYQVTGKLPDGRIVYNIAENDGKVGPDTEQIMNPDERIVLVEVN